MRAVDIIRRKREGWPLSPQELEWFVAGITAGTVSAPQVGAWLMAVAIRGMDAEETEALTGAMARSGARLDLSGLPGPKVDKHSTGGVGDKTSIVLAPLCAACGALVPMMSGRGLGHTGGTLDKLEAIPGLTTQLAADAVRAQVARVGCAIFGQTEEIAPADRVLYATRDATATVDSVPLITASIISKKIAEGIDALVLDVKAGRGAFMASEAEARALAETLVAVGHRAGLRTEALVTAMDAPLGRAVGNALEVAECLEVLRGGGDEDLRALCLELAARMLVLGRLAADDAAALALVQAALRSGAALEKFRAMVGAQGGDPAIVDDAGRLPVAPGRAVVTAPSTGVLAGLDARAIGEAAAALGAARTRPDGAIDPAVGVRVLVRPGEPVDAGEPVLELHYREAGSLERARAHAVAAVTIADAAPPRSPLIRQRVSVSPRSL